MSQVFGKGEWLDGGPNAGQTTWRTYDKMSLIVNSPKTFVFVDEHPDSINDSAFAVKCDGADQAGAAMIIDFPASYHNGACGFSFADGHCEIHRWRGSKIQAQVRYNGQLPLAVPAGDSWMDVRWMADNTTVKR